LGIRLPSAEEYEQKGAANSGDFTLLPADDYMVEVKDIIVQKDQVDIYSKETPPRVRDTLQVRCKVVSFANGDTLIDENGDDITDERLLFAFVDPTRVGIYQGQASFARKFFASALSVDFNGVIEFDDYNDLLGKRLIAVAIIKPNSKGVKKNKVIDFRPIRRRPARAKADVDPKVEAEAKLSDTDVVAKAKEIFEDDLPF